MKNPVFKVCTTSTGQPVDALVGPAGSTVELSASFFADPPDGGAARYDWEAVPDFCVDLGEPLTDPDFKRKVTLRSNGSLIVKCYDQNGFYLWSQQVIVSPT